MAFDRSSRRIAYLKDCWRDNRTNQPEIVTYGELHDKMAPNIPHVLCGGDVYDGLQTSPQITRSDYLQPPIIHTRLVFEEVGFDLKHYRYSFELIAIMYDAIEGAHVHNTRCPVIDILGPRADRKCAYEAASIMHCDISDSNILIYFHHPDGLYGLLIDWDSSWRIDQVKEVPPQTVRSGMSPPILNCQM